MVSLIHLTEFATTLGMFGWGFVYGFSWIWTLCCIAFMAIFYNLYGRVWIEDNVQFNMAYVKIIILVSAVCSWYLISGFSAVWLLCAIYAALGCYSAIDFLCNYKEREHKRRADNITRIATAEQLEKQILEGTVTGIHDGKYLIVPRHKKYARFYALCAAWYGQLESCLGGNLEEMERLNTKHPVGTCELSYKIAGNCYFWKKALTLKITHYDNYQQALQASRSSNASLEELYHLAYALESEEKVFKNSYPEQFAHEEKLRKACKDRYSKRLSEGARASMERLEATKQQSPPPPTDEKKYKSFGVMDMAIFYNVGKQVGKSGEASLGVVDGWMLREMRNQISQMSPDDQQHAQNTFLAGLAEASGNNKLKQAVMFDSVFKSIFG